MKVLIICGNGVCDQVDYKYLFSALSSASIRGAMAAISICASKGCHSFDWIGWGCRNPAAGRMSLPAKRRAQRMKA